MLVSRSHLCQARVPFLMVIKGWQSKQIHLLLHFTMLEHCSHLVANRSTRVDFIRNMTNKLIPRSIAMILLV